MIKPGLAQIRTLCTEQSFQRGRRYFEEGRVKITGATSSRITATVTGRDSYRVEMDLDDLSAVCSCPYGLEGYCKHIVATFLAIDSEPERVVKMRDDFSRQLEEVHALLERTDPDELTDFFARELETNPDLRARFMARFSPIGEGRSLSDYRDEIESIFSEAEDEHGLIFYDKGLDFTSLESLAAIHMEKEDFLEAAKIYQALTEKIAEKMDQVDDSDGYYSGTFSESLDALVECLLQAGLETDDRRIFIDYLFDRYLLRDPDYFRIDYFDALKELCTGKEDLEYWNRLLEPRIPGILPDSNEDWRKHHRAEELVSMRLYLLSRLKATTDIYDLMEAHYRSSSDLCLQYAQRLLKDGDCSKAIAVAEEGVALFPDHPSRYLRDFLCDNYRETYPEKYKEQLFSLFLMSEEWKYYERLKAAASKEEWQGTLDKILAHIAAERYGRTRRIEIFLREEMFDAAMSELMAQKSIHGLRDYHKKLANLYPKEFFAAYSELIFPYAECRMGREHYQDVASIIKRMKEIKGFESEVSEIVEQLRRENRRKPAFIDELKGL